MPELLDLVMAAALLGKGGTLGVSLSIVATMTFFLAEEGTVLFRGALAIFFQFLTTPAATHLLAKAAYVTEYPLSERTAVDELKSYLPSRPRESYGRE
jgi:multicomponent Na+:H+ antiporter subunit G